MTSVACGLQELLDKNAAADNLVDAIIERIEQIRHTGETIGKETPAGRLFLMSARGLERDLYRHIGIWCNPTEAAPW